MSWSSIVETKLKKPPKLTKLKNIKEFDKPFNREYIKDMLYFIHHLLPPELVAMIGEYIQYIFNPNRYIKNTMLGECYPSYKYEGLNFYRRFNLFPGIKHEKNHVLW